MKKNVPLPPTPLRPTMGQKYSISLNSPHITLDPSLPSSRTITLLTANPLPLGHTASGQVVLYEDGGEGGKRVEVRRVDVVATGEEEIFVEWEREDFRVGGEYSFVWNDGGFWYVRGQRRNKEVVGGFLSASLCLWFTFPFGSPSPCCSLTRLLIPIPPPFTASTFFLPPLLQGRARPRLHRKHRLPRPQIAARSEERGGGPREGRSFGGGGGGGGGGECQGGQGG